MRAPASAAKPSRRHPKGRIRRYIPRVDKEQRAQLRSWAKQVERESEHAEARAAARAVLMLTERVDELERELDYARAAERPREPAPAGRRRREREREEQPPRPAARAARTRPVRRRRRSRSLVRRPGRRVLVAAGIALLPAGLVFAGLAVAARVATPDLVAGGAAHDARVGARGVGSLVFWIEADRD